jgi:GNAT superfamily N-acetyltransferase
VQFRPYAGADRAACLALFDANCPEFFAPNERADYAEFLATRADGYLVCALDGRVVGAFGVYTLDAADAQINWMLLSPATQGRGIGTAIMDYTREWMREHGHTRLKISASHRSAPFFARLGAVEHERVSDGWGPGMHRVEMTLSTA